ncbi:MAG: hypothetical protein ACK54V_04055 [Candidatus Kapaibacterium sp.]
MKGWKVVLLRNYFCTLSNEDCHGNQEEASDQKDIGEIGGKIVEQKNINRFSEEGQKSSGKIEGCKAGG